MLYESSSPSSVNQSFILTRFVEELRTFSKYANVYKGELHAVITGNNILIFS